MITRLAWSTQWRRREKQKSKRSHSPWGWRLPLPLLLKLVYMHLRPMHDFGFSEPEWINFKLTVLVFRCYRWQLWQTPADILATVDSDVKFKTSSLGNVHLLMSASTAASLVEPRVQWWTIHYSGEGRYYPSGFAACVWNGLTSHVTLQSLTYTSVNVSGVHSI